MDSDMRAAYASGVSLTLGPALTELGLPYGVSAIFRFFLFYLFVGKFFFFKKIGKTKCFAAMMLHGPTR